MVKKRISKSFFAINKAKHVMDRHHLKTLYYSLVYPDLLYGITLWGATYHTYLSKLVIMQKKIIRIITGAKYDAHTKPLFKTAKLLKLDDIYRLQISKYMFCYIHNTLPKSLKLLSHIHGLGADMAYQRMWSAIVRHGTRHPPHPPSISHTTRFSSPRLDVV